MDVRCHCIQYPAALTAAGKKQFGRHRSGAKHFPSDQLARKRAKTSAKAKDAASQEDAQADSAAADILEADVDTFDGYAQNVVGLATRIAKGQGTGLDHLPVAIRFLTVTVANHLSDDITASFAPSKKGGSSGRLNKIQQRAARWPVSSGERGGDGGGGGATSSRPCSSCITVASTFIVFCVVTHAAFFWRPRTSTEGLRCGRSKTAPLRPALASFNVD